jgi:Tfp pilus assembly protein PilF
MQINLKKDAFLGQLFPGLKDDDWQDDSRLAQYLRNAYSRGGYTPEVKIEDDVVQISVDEQEVSKVNKVYQSALYLASKGAYDRAKVIIKPLLDEGTQNAELFRVYGQCLAEEGDKEGAMDYLIDALKWDPNHTESLIVMGNLYAEGKGDLETAQVFFDKVMELEPDNYLALNNIGGVLSKSGQLEQGAVFFKRALEAEPNFPFALYGLALTSFKTADYAECFDYCCRAMSSAGKDPQFRTLIRPIRGLMIEAASYYAETVTAEELYHGLHQELENATGRLIEIEPSDNIPTAAKLEVAEYKKRDVHRVLYKPEYSAVAHLIMHELIHLELIIEARAIDENQLFLAQNKEVQFFRGRTGAAQKRLAKAGFDESRIDGFLDMLFHGINSQIYNAPIDLFIEQRLYERYPALRPIQFLSLLKLNQEAVEGANTESAKVYSPRFVRDANITLSFTQLFLFRELFGLDMTGEIKEPRLYKKAEKLYADYLNMRADKEPGEEYDLVRWWGEDLELEGMYRLVGES